MMMMVQTISSKVIVMFALHKTKAIQVILWKHKKIIFIKNPFGWQCINRMYVDTKYIPQNTCISSVLSTTHTVYPKTYAHGFCFAVLCCDYTLTDFPISIRLTSLALWQSNDCPSASKAILMNMDKYFMWIHYERLHNHNKAKHNETVCIFLQCHSGLVPSRNEHVCPCHSMTKVGSWYCK